MKFGKQRSNAEAKRAPRPISEDAPAGDIGLELGERPLNKDQLSAILGISASGLDKLIAANRAPPAFRVGRMLRWWPSIVKQWTLSGGSRPEECGGRG